MTIDRTGYRAAATAATAAGAVLSAIVIAAMLHATLSRAADQPQKDPAAVAMVQALLAADAKGSPDSADNGALARVARELDARLRTDYFRRQALLRRGAWVLPFALCVFALGAKGLAALRRVWPVPETPVADRAQGERTLTARARWAIAGMGALAGTAVAVLTLLPPPAAPVPVAVAAAPATQSSASACTAWPQFRGPGGNGVTAAARLPLDFDVATGRNVRWRSPVPLEGKNSPIVWGKRLFCVGATEKQREVYCFDTDDGRLVWRRNVPLSASAGKVEVFDDTGWAPSTAATDGEHVAAIFPTMDLACFDLEGKPLWSINLGAVVNQYGHASSLLMADGNVIVQFDQREDADRSSRSMLLAFDAATGRKAWQTPRPTEAAWSSPILAAIPGGTQLIAIGNPWAIAYRPGNGEELWRAKVLGGDGGASPIYAGGLVLAGNTGTGLAGIRPDGRGDVTKSHVAWIIEDALGDVASPVSDGRRVYMTKTDGELGCFAIDAAKPALLWKQQFEMPFQASPTLAGRNIYLLAEKGTLIVFQAGTAYKELARSELGEDCPASPAFVDGRIFIRGAKNLYCIESGGK
ncbi:MAG: PQQ-binding-like beta-propeller repeat protein [Planctomycetota bacterium]